jgi:hypothetical protein
MDGSPNLPDGQITKSCPSLFPKIFPFRRRANQNYKRRRPVPRRGVGHRHERWDGMRWTRQRRAREVIAGRVDPRERSAGAQDERRFNAFAKTSAGCTWPAGACWQGRCVRRSRVVLASVADVKFAEVFPSPTGRGKTANSQTTVTKRNSSPGRARRKPLKPFACGNAGLFRWTCGDYRVLPPTTAHGLRARQAPGIPHALFGRTLLAQLGRIAPRE